MRRKIVVRNTPPHRIDRASQMLTAVTCDLRLESALDVLQEAQTVLMNVQWLTSDIREGGVDGILENFDIVELDESIESATSMIEEIIDDDYSIKNRRRIMAMLVSYVQKHKEC